MDQTRRRAVRTLSRLLGAGTIAAAAPAAAGIAADAGPDTPRGPVVSVTDFGARGDGSTDCAEALSRAFAWVSSVHAATDGATPRLFVPGGTYAYQRSPNFAITNLALDCAPGVVFRHLGDGPAFLLDGGAEADGVYRTRILGSPTIRGNARSDYGIDVRALHHSVVTGSVRDVAVAVLRTRWSVATEYQVRSTGLGVAGNRPAPVDGFVLDRRRPSEDTADCLFRLPIVEQVRNVGLRLVHAGNCTFISGTSESNGVGGIHVEAGSSCNSFIGSDLEFNGRFGILCEGNRNGFIGAYEDKLSIFAGAGNWVQGHQFNAVENRGDGNSFELMGYAAAGGAFVDRGSNTRKSLVRNLATGRLDPDRFGLPGAAVPVPAGGAVRDLEARAAIATLITRLQAAGLIE